MTLVRRLPILFQAFRKLPLTFRVILCLALFASPGPGLQAEEPNWYQVEMIIFANLAGRWQDSEKWRDEFNLIYPKNLAILRPFKAFEFEEIDTDFEHLRRQYKPEPLMPEDQANASQVLPEQPITSESELAALAEEELLDSELSADQTAESEVGETAYSATGFDTFPEVPLVAATNDQPKPAPVELKPMDLRKDPFILLPEEDLQLADSARRMRNAYDLRVISHIAWRQPAQERGRAAPVLIQGGDQFGLDFELEGLAQLSENRFVHVDVNLNLSQFQRSLIDSSSNWQEFGNTRSTQPATPTGDLDFDGLGGEIGNNLFGTENSEFERIFTVNSTSTRRVRSGELHYIDHPLIGVLVQVTPYSLPDPVMEMKDFDLEAIPARKPVPFFIAPVTPEGTTAE